MNRLLAEGCSVSVTSPDYLERVLQGSSASPTTVENNGAGPRVRVNEICDRIRESRLTAGWTQEDMAHYLGVTARTYRHWEKSRIPPNKYWPMLERLTGRDERWFLFGEDADQDARLERLEAQVATVAEQLHRVLLLLEGRPLDATETGSSPEGQP